MTTGVRTVAKVLVLTSSRVSLLGSASQTNRGLPRVRLRVGASITTR